MSNFREVNDDILKDWLLFRVDELSSLTKEYIAQVKVGIKTDTLDIYGNVLEERKCK